MGATTWGVGCHFGRSRTDPSLFDGISCCQRSSIHHPRTQRCSRAQDNILALLRVGTAGSARGFGAYSLRTYFYCLRALIRWMSEIGSRASLISTRPPWRVQAGYRSAARLCGTYYFSRDPAPLLPCLSSLYRHRGAVRDAYRSIPSRRHRTRCDCRSTARSEGNRLHTRRGRDTPDSRSDRVAERFCRADPRRTRTACVSITE